MYFFLLFGSRPLEGGDGGVVRSSGQMLIGFFLSLHRLLLRKMDPLWPFHRIFGCFFCFVYFWCFAGRPRGRCWPAALVLPCKVLAEAIAVYRTRKDISNKEKNEKEQQQQQQPKSSRQKQQQQQQQQQQQRKISTNFLRFSFFLYRSHVRKKKRIFFYL